MYFIKILLFWSLSFAVLASNAKITPLQDFVNQLKTFSADFEQIQPEEELMRLNLSEGSILLKRPGKLVWQYTKPDPQKIVIDGKNLWVYDTDLDQVTVRAVSEIQNDLPLSWLLFQEPIETKYRIIYGGLLKGVEWFNLAPKENTFFQSLDVGMRDGLMVEVHMYQNADNVTKVKFKNIKINSALSDEQFEFSAPKGVDVIGQPQ